MVATFHGKNKRSFALMHHIYCLKLGEPLLIRRETRARAIKEEAPEEAESQKSETDSAASRARW